MTRPPSPSGSPKRWGRGPSSCSTTPLSTRRRPCRGDPGVPAGAGILHRAGEPAGPLRGGGTDYTIDTRGGSAPCRRGHAVPGVGGLCRYPWGGQLRSAPLGRGAPGAPPARQGSPFLPKWGERRAGGKPLDPGFLWPLVATRWVWGSSSLIRSKGYFVRYTKTDLGRIFREKYAGKHFLRKKVPKSGHVHGPRTRRTTGTMWHPTPKRASGNERVINQGVQGRGPGVFPPAFSGESRAPARSRAGNHLAEANLRQSRPNPPANPAGIFRLPY